MPVDDMLDTPVLHQRDMPYVAFKTETIEDKKRTQEDGVMRFKDQDYAVITPPGGKGNNIERIDSFFCKMEYDAKAGRVHPDWIRKWRSDYEFYRKGQEIPLDGTPIKGWKLITGAQQEELIRLHVLTVESLANLTDEGMRHVGKGALELKRKAQAWLEQNHGKEAGAVKLASVMRENDTLKETVANLTEKVEQLAKLVESKKK